jgi:ABC-type Na+ efflux pump permease subunit
VWTIAVNTFIEALRQKVFNILLIIALLVIASASFFAQFSFSEQIKFVKDFCLGALSVFGMLIAIVGTAPLLPSEVENRTIYTILAKPVRRFEFLLGKYCGVLLLIFLSVLMMSMMFGAALVFKQTRLKADVEAVGHDGEGRPASDVVKQIRAEAYDPDVAKGIELIFVKLALIAALTLLVSTFSTSMVFNVTVAFMLWLAGNLRGTAAEMWGQHKIVMAALAVVPDLSAFNAADDIVIGNVIPWPHVGLVSLYGLSRIAIIVVAAHVIFSRREI